MRKLDDLRVKAGMTGVLQLVSVERGAQVSPGTNLVRVADPTNLKAEVRIAETQTKDLRLGQFAEIDTRNGIVQGKVARIDPASSNGTVGVDVILDGALPPGARPDLSVDGTIRIEKLDNVVFVGRPAFGQDEGTVSMFKLLPTGEAVRTNVKLGRSSVNTIEIKEGLQPGRPGDPLRHVQLRPVRPHPVEGLTTVADQQSTVTMESMMNTAAQTLIHLDGVTKVFFTDEVETHALAGIHLEIKTGEYIAIAGPSGCGKSTLLSILGLLDSPTDGKYILNGKSVADLPLSERARVRNREIGFIFQSFNLIGDLNVYENVELPLTYRGMKSAERKERVMAALEKVGMAHRSKHLPTQLSGGQQQRVAVARAVAGSPRSCWRTSRPETSTRRTARRSWSCCASCTAKARRSAWSRTTRATRATPTAPSTCSTAASSRKTAASAPRRKWKRAGFISSTRRAVEVWIGAGTGQARLGDDPEPRRDC